MQCPSFRGVTSQNLNFAVPVEAVTKLRQDSASGLAAAVRHLIPKKETPQFKPKNEPDLEYFADPDSKVLGRCLHAGDWIGMLKIAKPMAAKHPDAPSAHYYHGFSLHALGLLAQAETAYKQGLAIDPENAGLWRLIGSTQDGQKRSKEARESWKKAVGIAPDDALSWQYLAASNLKDEDFLEAVSPLESLRKLDRGKFDELLAACRSLRVHPPELQSMLYHFDNLAEPDIAVAAPTKPEELAASLVAAFLRHGVAPDVQAELADYAPTVNPFFDQGAQQHPAILKDITTYRASWPRRTLNLIGVESARRDDLNTLEATYRLRYSAASGKKTRSGTLIQGVRYTLTDKRWLVSGIQTIERVAE